MPAREDAQTKIYDLILWFFPKVERFPGRYRFLIGDRIRNMLLDIQQELIRARFTRKKSRILFDANIEIEQLRHLMRLTKDLRLISVKQYEYAVKELDATGRFIGGWLRTIRTDT